MSHVDTTVQPRQALNLQKATLLHCAAREGSGRGQRRAAACSHLSWLRIVLFPFPKIVLYEGRGREEEENEGGGGQTNAAIRQFLIFSICFTLVIYWPPLPAPLPASLLPSVSLSLSHFLSLSASSPVTVNAAVSSAVAAALLLPHSVDMQLSLTAANLHVLHSQWAAACCCTRCRR